MKRKLIYNGTQMAKLKSSYDIYNQKAKVKTKYNILEEFFPKLPNRKYSIIYSDPPWHYDGKMQFDKSGKSEFNSNWEKDVFVSAASFKYPTIKIDQLKNLDVDKIADDDSLLFMWCTSPHLKQGIELGTAWGFEYKTVGFIWNKMIHNPGQYTLSYCELCLIFKKGRIPKPRGARNIKQLINFERNKHSEKPEIVAQNIQKMFPIQKKIELFARVEREGWDAWGLETIYHNKIINKEEISNKNQNGLLTGLG
ncbi:MAG: MT-A70 family methyltransferase [Alphaproteobacteria bacterium]